jgi:hypothetical protein
MVPLDIGAALTALRCDRHAGATVPGCWFAAIAVPNPDTWLLIVEPKGSLQ